MTDFESWKIYLIFTKPSKEEVVPAINVVVLEKNLYIKPGGGKFELSIIFFSLSG